MLVGDPIFACLSYTHLLLFVFLVHSGTMYLHRASSIPDSEFMKGGCRQIMTSRVMHKPLWRPHDAASALSATPSTAWASPDELDPSSVHLFLEGIVVSVMALGAA